jgi:hypothetical protein
VAARQCDVACRWFGGSGSGGGGGAQRDSGSAVAAARWLRRWRQRDIVTSVAAWRLRGSGGSGDLVWGVDQRVVAMVEVGERVACGGMF